MLCVARFIKRAQVSVWAPHSDRLLNQFQAPANVRPYYLASSLSLSIPSFLFTLAKLTHTFMYTLRTHSKIASRVGYLDDRTIGGRRCVQAPNLRGFLCLPHLCPTVAAFYAQRSFAFRPRQLLSAHK